jgi:hypothetical protein
MFRRSNRRAKCRYVSPGHTKKTGDKSNARVAKYPSRQVNECGEANALIQVGSNNGTHPFIGDNFSARRVQASLGDRARGRQGP